MTAPLPSIFVSHGAPNLVLQEAPARRFLEALGQRLLHGGSQPRAILVATAHWESEVAQAGGAAAPSTIHDFGRFDDRLFQMRYAAPGDPALAARAVALVTAAGMPAAVDPRHGLDHGVWVPLMLMLPGADIPVVPFSVQPHRGAAHSYRVGQALAPLRDEGVLIMGSGSYTHDLSRFRGRALDGATPDDVAEFAGWFDSALMQGRTADLLAYRMRGPHAEENHPTEEHLLPLFVAMGAGWRAGGGAAEHLHESATYGVLRMDAYAFS
jgi:4,5-DOPA dioxygenase extradiol